MITARALVKSFGYRLILRRMDLEINAGEFVVLFGPNGAGKTTLLRLLCGLARPNFGEIRVGGYRLTAEAEKVYRRLGVVLHQPLLYTDLNAEENLRFYARLYGLHQPAARIVEVLEMARLPRNRRDPVRDFSRGMQQRLSLARAILHDPEVLILDEPYTGLDPDGAAWLDSLLRDLAARGRTILMTTHDIERGLSLASRALVLEGGEISSYHDGGRRTEDEGRRTKDEGPRPKEQNPKSSQIPEAERRGQIPHPNDQPPATSNQLPATDFRLRTSDFLQGVTAIVWKDLAAEARSKELVSAMLIFSLLAVIIFSFALDLERNARETVISGVLWVTFIFAGTLGLNRSLALEQDRGSLEGLLLAPLDRSVIYFGKLIGNLVFMAVVEAIIIPLFTLLFNLPLLNWGLALTAVLGTLGYAAVGTLLAAMAVRTRAREVMLPILILPVIIPLVLSVVRATTGFLQHLPWEEITPWLNVLIVYDAIFLAVAFMVFDFVVEE
jgi:heme ABC exporter ATP-binding subunit CcmA/heme exporter protein CcmB